MGVVLAGSKARLLFFPFKDRSRIYSDAIVTEEMDLHAVLPSFFKIIANFIGSNKSIGISSTKWSHPLTKRDVHNKLIVADQTMPS